MKLSIITLTCNKIEYTKKFIKSLYKYTNDFELIIVDNGSTDGTVEYLRTLPDAKLILNKENLGFSKGNNQGIEIAEGEYIGFLNNDILLYPNWFEKIEEVFEKENIGFISPRQVCLNLDRLKENNYIDKYKNIYKLDYEKNFNACEFSCVITKRSVLNSIGYFDENYFPAFYEDNDLKYRAIQCGFGVYVLNTVCFYHFGSITSKKYDYNLSKNRKYYSEKFQFAEYLTKAAEERDFYKRMLIEMNKFPIPQIYAIYVFLRRLKNRLLKRKNRNENIV